MNGKFNFLVKAQSKTGDAASENQKIVRKFLQKWKKSGILKEIRDGEDPVTKGQKIRLKKKAGARRAKKSWILSRNGIFMVCVYGDLNE